jgi:Na+-translocating ferredoxin:NAD+ oxidoreductase subunit E
MDKKKRSAHLSALLSPLWKENPLFVLILGTCPALGVTTSLEAALGMGFLFTFVLVGSNVLVSALKRFIPEEVETPAYIVIIATFVVLVEMFSEAFLPELYSSLGVFISLLVVNCIVLGRAEAFANKNSVLDSLCDGVGNGIGYTIAICMIAIIREVLGTGAITFGSTLTFLPNCSLPILNFSSYGGPDFSIALFSQPAGAFIVLGVIMAVIQANKLAKAAKEKEAKKLAAIKTKEEAAKEAK